MFRDANVVILHHSGDLFGVISTAEAYRIPGVVRPTESPCARQPLRTIIDNFLDQPSNLDWRGFQFFLGGIGDRLRGAQVQVLY